MISEYLIVASTEARARIGRRLADPPPGGYHRTPCCHCCGAVYATRRDWLTLDWVGTMPDHAGGQLELRNCRCGSTLSRQVQL